MPGSRPIRIVAALAVPWKLVGVASYLAHVGVLGPGGPPAGGAEMPPLITACYAIGTFAGLGGAIGLALLRAWARPVLWIALLALLVDWGWVFGFSGAASVPIGIAVLLIAAVLVVLAEQARRHALLR